MRLRNLFGRLLCLIGAAWLVAPEATQVASAQTCQSCGWTVGTPYEYYTYNTDYCKDYYDAYPYYYCGQYEYTNPVFLYEVC
jgi:hypothetical protein